MGIKYGLKALVKVKKRTANTLKYMVHFRDFEVSKLAKAKIVGKYDKMIIKGLCKYTSANGTYGFPRPVS
jgi:hypothetical protein